MSVEKGLIFYCSGEFMGEGDNELGRILRKNFFYTLAQGEKYPEAIVFINSGVKLTSKTSPAAEYLLELEKKGVQILACGTCLDFYKIKNMPRVGKATNMENITDLLLKSEQVVTI